MSSKYEQLGNRFTTKLDALETTSQNLTLKFEAIQRQKVMETNESVAVGQTIEATAETSMKNNIFL